MNDKEERGKVREHEEKGVWDQEKEGARNRRGIGQKTARKTRTTRKGRRK